MNEFHLFELESLLIPQGKIEFYINNFPEKYRDDLLASDRSIGGGYSLDIGWFILKEDLSLVWSQKDASR